MRLILAGMLIAVSGPASFAAPPKTASPKATSPKATPEQIEFFEKKVRPVLAEKCYSCHGPKKQSAGLRLDTAAGVRAGTDEGPVIVAGNPGKSLLIASILRKGDNPMPPKESLSPAAIGALTEWVRQGAPLPPDRARPTTDPRKHWAFQPIGNPKAPTIPGSGGIIRNEIDTFVIARLQANGLSQAAPADRRTLIRRAYYDLLGLPPTAEEIEAFEKDPSPRAFESLVDRLLASPHYGERWGRYWLDVARYADTKGYVFQEARTFPFAYTYRDYVIRSFNEDKPFNQFIVEQLAADRLPLGADKRPLAAMGYLTLGRRFLNNPHDIIDDRIDVVCRGFMGLTMSCARCHDHKFDPVPMKDYYSLYGVFASSMEPKDLPLIGQVERTPKVLAFEKELAKRESGYSREVARRYADTMAKLKSSKGLADYLSAALDCRGKPAPARGTVARDRGLVRFVLEKWHAYLVGQAKRHSPIFSLLIALQAANGPGYAAKAPAILRASSKALRPLPPRLLEALAKAKTFRSAVESVAASIAESHWYEADLRAVLASGGPLDIPLADAEKIFNRLDRNHLTAIRKQIDAFKATNPAAPPRAHVLNDKPKPVEPVVFLRGNPNSRGARVPRQFPEILAGDHRTPFKEGSGRLELARAIASPENPLTARVFVNRVWIGHFGQGLVRTPSDFGLRSDPPTHPELLDWLASRFIQNGWSVKKLHRTIMLSSTYRQSSFVSPRSYETDVDNRLLSHQNRRRLDFESLRDSLLAAAGRLDPAIGGRPVNLFKAPFTTRRSVYGLVDRSNLPGTLRSFDFASPDQHSPQRFQTTVPQQALFLLNSPFVVEQARGVVGRPEVKGAAIPDSRIAAIYRAVLGRNPRAEELSLGRQFVSGESRSSLGKWEQLAQVLLLSNEFTFVD